MVRQYRYTDMGDGTIRDNTTGLIWLKNASCRDLPGTDAACRTTWENAKSAAAALADGMCGLRDGSKSGDWRLPTKEEWEAVISQDYDYPSLVNTAGDAQWSEGDAFTGVQSYYYWSSTEYTGSLAWQAFLPYGVMLYNNKELHRCVWPIRSAD